MRFAQSRRLRPLSLLSPVLLLLGAACANASVLGSARDGAANGDALVQYRVDLMQPQTQTVQVTITVPTDGLEFEDFYLPVWRPGRYTILNPAGTVRKVSAISETGQELVIRKMDKSGWRVITEGAQEVSVSYSIYANSLGLRTRHVDPTHAFLSGSSVFFYSPRLRSAPLEVEVDAPAGWTIGTGLEFAPGRDDVVVAANYDVLVDSPLEIGEHDSFSFEVAGKAHDVVLWPSGMNYDEEQIAEDFGKIIEEQMAVFGSLPYERYVFLIHTGGGGGGTEHLNSTIMQTSRSSIEGSDGRSGAYKRFLGLVSHEFFHTWNVKQFRPVGIHPYDYQNENLTDLLWVCEGGTSYYSALTMVRNELSEVESYITRIGSSGNSTRNNPAARVQSVAEASWDSWVNESDGDSGNRTVDFYGKGSQTFLCLDLELLRRSAGKVGMDRVMRELFERYPLSGPGFSSADLLGLVDELSGESFEQFFRDYVFGTEELPFEQSLLAVGLEFYFDPNEPEESDDEEEEVEEQVELKEGTDVVESTEADDSSIEVAQATEPQDRELPMRAYLGLKLGGGGSGSRVSGFRADGPAYTSGLMLGDEILTLNERRLRPGDVTERIAEFEPGDVIKLHYLRDDTLRVMEVVLGGVPDGSWKVRRLEDPTDLQKELYQTWIGHIWPGDEEEQEDASETEVEVQADGPAAAAPTLVVPSPAQSTSGAQ
ncbi:MAG: putative metalloprotease with PDZ domain [Planctomycetota bacterium]|jgi:predicted metalloprotease with PDZ domain